MAVKKVFQRTIDAKVTAKAYTTFRLADLKCIKFLL